MSQGVIQGSMREAPLPDVIQLVAQGGKSGCFHIQQDTYRARIHLREGRIVHAVSHHHEGLEALLDVALWLDGSYIFEEAPQNVPNTISKPNAFVLMELGRRMDEWRIISQKIPSIDLYPQSILLPGEMPLGVNPREAKLLALITGYYSLTELADLLQKPLLTVAKDLYGLIMAGHVHLKAVRSGKPPKVEAAPMTPSAPSEPSRLSTSQLFAGSMEAEPGSQTAIVRLTPPPPAHTMQGFPLADEPLPETVGGGISQRESPRPKPTSGGASTDPVRMAKLTAFTQRIASTAKEVLPLHLHEMVNRLQHRATQQIISGEGAEAVKNLALTVSRGAVDSGCDAELVRTLNARLKALFSR